MKKWILFILVLITVSVKAQKEKGEAYINSYKELAMAEMLRSGVPASITLAQGILESQFGESDLVKNSNNHFGIKCKTEWTGAKTYHDDDEKAECFRVYPTAAESYKDHSDFLKTRPNYAFLFKLDPTDYEGWAKGLKKAGYATNPAYPQKLLKVINDYNLQQYSLLALTKQKTDINNTPVISNPTVESGPKVADVMISNVSENTTLKEADTKEKETPQTTISITSNTIETKTKKSVSYPSGVFSINHSKVIYAAEGTSLLSMAIQYDLPLSKLIEFNDLADMDVLDTDRLIFIEKKMKKGGSDLHVVEAGESLHGISQQEGIRLENLLELNHLAKGATVSAGDKLLLRTVSIPAQPKK
jgi:LysM repeat protein